jgi:hypothetical protein
MRLAERGLADKGEQADDQQGGDDLHCGVDWADVQLRLLWSGEVGRVILCDRRA